MFSLTQPKFKSAIGVQIAAFCLVLALLFGNVSAASAQVFSLHLFSDSIIPVASADTNPPETISAAPTTTNVAPTMDVSDSASGTLNLFPIAIDPPSTTPDERAVRIDTYFAKHDMPLAGYGQNFITVADECGMDWQLLPAIAVRESSGGKHMLRNNPFGWASAKIGFESLDDAIQTVGEHLCGLNPKTARYYKDKTTAEKLYRYNGTVVASYPKEVMAIMKMF